jgi:DNA primase
LNSPETGIYSKGRVLFNLDKAKEAIRKLDYAILVEGQMDCISVYAAGFHNVIASSGTAFTEIQAKLLGRFSKNAVVNFDPDTAGAKATERTLGLLVEEEFQIKVLTLEQGFDPDLFIRRKGKDATARLCGIRKILRLSDRPRPKSFSRAQPRGQTESGELPAAPHSARAQPHRPRRVGARRSRRSWESIRRCCGRSCGMRLRSVLRLQ